METDPARADPHLLSLATAVPQHELPQDAVLAFAPQLFADRPPEELDRLLPVFANAGVERRFSAVPLVWLLQEHAWHERMELYQATALELLAEATGGALAEAGLEAGDIDAVVTVSTTGFAAPSLEARLMSRLGFRPDIIRLPIFGLGCGGGVAGLARAADLARAHPGAQVLLLVVELCVPTFRRRDQSKANIIAAALFGDGAAALVLGPGKGPRLVASGDWTWPDTLRVMGWSVEDEAFGLMLSRSVPHIAEHDLPPVLLGFLARRGLGVADIDAFALHPGGAKVLEGLARALHLCAEEVEPARQILRRYGNMSSPTALFVLRRLLDRGFRRCLTLGLGPGFSAEFVLLEGEELQ